MSKESIPEPWMFGVEASIDGEQVQPTIGKFTLRGRMRMAWRVFRGRPALGFSLIEQSDD